MDFDDDDFDYEEGTTSSDDEGIEMDNNAQSSDEKQRDYKVVCET